MFDLYLLVYLCGYMVTAVTVTVFGVLEARHKRLLWKRLMITMKII